MRTVKNLFGKYFFKALIFIVLCGFGLLIISSIQKHDYRIRLRWVKAYESEDWPKVRIGLIWAFSYLGAELPKGSFDESVTQSESNGLFTIDLEKLGFSEQSLKAFEPILDELKSSEEYKKTGGIDIGRFLMFTVHSSRHYYTITGASTSVSKFETKYSVKDPLRYVVVNSGVAKVKRLIQFNRPNRWDEIAFMGSEAEPSGDDHGMGFETIDVMKNGQLRFGIYGKGGILDDAANPLLTSAGKPGKCQWCHEKHLQMIFYPTEDVPNSLTKDEFVRQIDSAQGKLNQYRNLLNSDITYQNPQDHAFAELLYISFLEPSAYRISNEWGIAEPKVKELLRQFPTHPYEEYPFLGDLYQRKWIDSLASYRSVRVPES
ncbi:MAG: hypothetical protein K2Q22_07465, partial [Cytophagales bacterium]|nr:hypothetical protein [Cytophagales bacterium]